MKLVFLVYSEIIDDRVMELLKRADVDFFTQWEKVKGKGHETMPHFGTRTFPGMNSVMMIGFENEKQLETLIEYVINLNKGIKIKDDLIRVFQVPLEKII